MRYFEPINEGGIVIFTQDAEAAGWYQLPVPGATLDTLPLIVPEGTTAVFVQAVADLDFSQSPAQAIVDPATAMRLPVKGTMFLPGADAVRNLCFRLGDSGGAFVVQFYQGEIGPTLSHS